MYFVIWLTARSDCGATDQQSLFALNFQNSLNMHGWYDLSKILRRVANKKPIMTLESRDCFQLIRGTLAESKYYFKHPLMNDFFFSKEHAGDSVEGVD